MSYFIEMIVIIKFLKSNEFEMANESWLVRDAGGENVSIQIFNYIFNITFINILIL